MIQDIDKVGGDNQLTFMDYVNDLYKFYKVAEVTAEGVLLRWCVQKPCDLLLV